MAAIEITVDGILYDKLNRTTQNVVIFGQASLTGLGVGGGPSLPTPQPPQQPPLHPQFPINLPPGTGWLPGGPSAPGGYPPSIGGGPIIPPPPTDPPPNSDTPKPPPPGGGWGWHPEYGWGYFPMVGGKPQPPG